VNIERVQSIFAINPHKSIKFEYIGNKFINIYENDEKLIVQRNQIT